MVSTAHIGIVLVSGLTHGQADALFLYMEKQLLTLPQAEERGWLIMKEPSLVDMLLQKHEYSEN